MGSNLGHREDHLALAVRRLATVLSDLRVAPLFETAPVSPVSQPDYLNTAVVGRTRLAPAELLALCKRLELEAGRERGERWGPRPLDIDLLLYWNEAADPPGDELRDDPELTLPHPRLRERLFYLAPLAALVPDRPVPPDGATVRELLDRLVKTSGEPALPASRPFDPGI